MAGMARRGLQIAWAALRLGIDFLRMRRRTPERLPARVSATLVGLGTTFVKLGQGLSLRWDLLPTPYREALSRLQAAALLSLRPVIAIGRPGRLR